MSAGSLHSELSRSLARSQLMAGSGWIVFHHFRRSAGTSVVAAWESWMDTPVAEVIRGRLVAENSWDLELFEAASRYRSPVLRETR